MPAAAVIVPAVAGIVGGVIQSRAASRASQAQQKSISDALAYEKENQANRTARYDAAMADYRKRYDAWLEQFYGVKPSGGADSGVKASSAGAGMAQPGMPSASAVTPGYGTPGGGNNSIAKLILAQGQNQADAATQSGNIWGNTVAGIGQGIGQGLKNYPQKPQVQMTGAMQPGVDKGVPAAWEPTPMPLAGQGGPFDWRNYLYSGGIGGPS